jgi:hypothetical protein
MTNFNFEKIGEHAEKLEKVKGFLELYCDAPYPGQKKFLLKKLQTLLDNCPFYICDLLIAEAVKQLGIDTPQAIMIVAERYRIILQGLMDEIRSKEDVLDE